MAVMREQLPPAPPGAPEDRALLVLFDDLEQQAAGQALVERDEEVAGLAVAEYAAVPLAARLHASVGQPVTVLLGGETVRGELDRVGTDCLLLRAEHPGRVRRLLVPLAAVDLVGGLSGRAVAVPARPLQARLGITAVLRRLSEERVPCRFRVRTGQVDGIPARVGADFCEVAGADGAAHRGVVPLRALLWVQEQR